MRENAHAKARRLLGEGRVVLLNVHGRLVRAQVRGDSGVFYEVTHEHGTWHCDCEARSQCSHVQACQLVTAPIRRVGCEGSAD
jgi:uncharacterized Zn finger protein